ncbi:hypothetical protein [Streptomyces sp. NPDC024089]
MKHNTAALAAAFTAATGLTYPIAAELEDALATTRQTTPQP